MSGPPQRQRAGYRDYRRDLDELGRVALEAADPTKALLHQLSFEDPILHAGQYKLTLAPQGRVFMIAAGKAAAKMCQAAVPILGHRLAGGIAAVPLDAQQTPPLPMVWYPAGHPLPDGGSLAAGRATAALLQTATAEDLIVALISGGGSAMMELPLPGISLADLAELNQLLINSGAPIADVNTVRSCLSMIKGGGLARLAYPARTVSFILSDVMQGGLSAVASGPTVPKTPDRSRARQILEGKGLWSQVPPAIQERLASPGGRPARARRPINVLIADNRSMLRYVRSAAAEMGFTTLLLTSRLQGEARQAGVEFARRLSHSWPGTCLIMGGETTVSVRGSGKGGRNQEFALAAAIELGGRGKLAIMALASDGRDGPTDAAGAIVCGESLAGMVRAGIDPHHALAENDSYHALRAVGALIQTGPTGTNLNDLIIGLHYAC
jgi:glycerate 2-kinase